MSDPKQRCHATKFACCLGFLKVEAGETTHQSNFGLVDQVAALLWIKANIDAFGGDPGKVTLLGHGTGAVFASLLTISPMAIYEQNERKFFSLFSEMLDGVPHYISPLELFSPCSNNIFINLIKGTLDL